MTIKLDCKGFLSNLALHLMAFLRILGLYILIVLTKTIQLSINLDFVTYTKLAFLITNNFI